MFMTLFFRIYVSSPNPLRRPKHFNFILALFIFRTVVACFLEPIWAMFTRPVPGPYESTLINRTPPPRQPHSHPG